MDTALMSERIDEGQDRTTIRVLALGGIAFGALEFAGDLIIGPFPRGGTGAADLMKYYAGHHSHVATGGTLMAWAAVGLGLFGAGLFGYVRRGAGAALAAVVLVGTAMAALSEGISAATYSLLGEMSTDRNLMPAALQAWHVAGAEYGIGAGMTLLLVGVAAAGILRHAFPVWLAWPALILAVAQLTPFGFLASLVVLLWCLVTGAWLAIRPAAGTRS